MHLVVERGDKSSSQFEKEEHALARRKSLSARLLLPCALCLVLAAAVIGCADEDIPEPKPQPLMTRADSIAAGLLVVSPITVHSDWDGESVYDFDGNATGSEAQSGTQIAVGGTDTDAAEGDDGRAWGE